MRISELMKPELAGEMAATRNLLARVPDDKLEWSPGAGLHSIGWNASHLVEIVGWVAGIIQQDEWDITPPEGGAERSQAVVADLLKKFDANAIAALAALEGVPDEAMAQPWTLKAGDYAIFTLPRGDCLRKWVFSHVAHHRAILSTYLRLAGVPHDSIYESDWAE